MPPLDKSTAERYRAETPLSVTTNTVLERPLESTTPSARDNNEVSGNGGPPENGPAALIVSKTPINSGGVAIPVMGSGSGLRGPFINSTEEFDQVFSDPFANPVMHRYPSDLPERVQMIIKLGKYDSQIALGAESKVRHDTSIALPIPGSLLDSLGLDYNTLNLGFAMGPLAGSVDRIANAITQGQGFTNTYNNTLEATKNEISRLYNNLDVGNLSKAIISRSLGTLSGSIGSAFNMGIGATPNPHIAVNFNNVRLRTFNFTWKFSPNSEQESKTLVRIIETLQRRSLPEKKGVLLNYPSQCMLEIKPTPFHDLFKFKPCVIDNISVNYAPTGIPSFFVGTQLPTEMDVSISLQEIQIRTANDYNTGDSK